MELIVEKLSKIKSSDAVKAKLTYSSTPKNEGELRFVLPEAS